MPIRLGADILQKPKTRRNSECKSLFSIPYRADLAKSNLTSTLTRGTSLKKQKFLEQKTTKLPRLARKKIEPWVEWTHQTGYFGQAKWRESLHYEPHQSLF